MDYLFKDVKKTFTRVANKVTRQSGKYYQISKHTLAISGINSDIKEEYEKIGRKIYDGYKNNEISSQDVSAHCELIDEKFKQIEKHRLILSDLKNSRMCPQCQAEISKESTFCANCGEKMQNE
ncbi:MAG: zinc ribbon domain-containing protein [Clostridiaceae bacterium]|nr:zinc ribbon domain-containing protein [Clostridiaceae bacterium]